MKPLTSLIPTITLIAATFAAVPASQAGDTFKWNVQYLIDNSQSLNGESQKVTPRRNRGLAISPDGNFLYAGYHHAGDGVGEVRKIAISESEDYSKATVATLHGPGGKAIACDDKGRVYIANNNVVDVYDADLTKLIESIVISATEGVQCEGLMLNREGADLVLYAANRLAGTVHRFVLTEKGNELGEYKAAGFDGDGVTVIQGALELRGLDVDDSGRVWACDHESGRVFRISKDGKTVDHVDVPNAQDVQMEGGRAYVTRGTDRLIAVINADDMKLLGNLAIPWDELELTPTGNNRKGALAGIVAIKGKGFFVSNETGQTAHQKSTYGKVDGNSDKIGDKVYRDSRMDDNDPILRALEIK